MLVGTISIFVENARNNTDQDIPLMLFSPSGVSLLSRRRVYGLSSCNILATVTGYVNILVACLMLLSELMALKFLVYKKVSQFVIFTMASSSCGPA